MEPNNEQNPEQNLPPDPRFFAMMGPGDAEYRNAIAREREEAFSAELAKEKETCEETQNGTDE